MIANFNDEPTTSTRIQQVSNASPPPRTIVKSKKTYAHIFSISTDEKQTYNECILKPFNTALVDQYLAGVQNSHVIEEDKPIITNYIALSNGKSKHPPRICNML